MNTLSIHLQSRPVKIGWCIRENNLEDYQKALQLTHTLWGGRFNPLVVIGDDEERAKKLISYFKVDVLFPIEKEQSLLEFIQKFPHLPWPGYGEPHLFVPSIKGCKVSKFLDIFQASINLGSILKGNNCLDDHPLNLMTWEENDPLRYVYHATFGHLPSSTEIDSDFDYKELLSKSLKTNETVLNSTKQFEHFAC